MNYIGSKQRLSPWIFEIILKNYPRNLNEAIFADIFSGTGQVARYFKPHVKSLICNDLEAFSYVLNYHYIKNSRIMLEPKIEPFKKEGCIYKNFAPGSGSGRMYFTDENAKIIDGIRQITDSYLKLGYINKGQYYWILASLIEAADNVANTASVYGAFLKSFKKTALNTLDFKFVPYLITNQDNQVFQEDANKLIKEIKGDILYLDPPYNHRQYGSNYHVLNRIVDNKNFNSNSKTGVLDYNKSNYCKKDKVYNEFEELIRCADFEFIFISYNNEGLLSPEKFKSLLEKFGNYYCFQTEYKRFKANSKSETKSNSTMEYLHLLQKK